MCMFVSHLGTVNAPDVYRPPSKEDVGDDEGDEDGDVAHHLEREEAGAAVLYRKRALQVGQRRVISRMVESGAKEQGRHRQDRTRTSEPYPLPTSFLEECLPYAKQNSHDAHQEHAQYPRHLKQVVQILLRLHIHLLRDRIYGKAFRQQQVEKEQEEEDEECATLLLQMSATTGVNLRIVNIINEIEQSQHTRQAKDCHAKHEVPDIRDGFQPVPRRRPLRDNGHRKIGQMLFIDYKLGSCEKCRHGCP